jgi:hypothetical protein
MFPENKMDFATVSADVVVAIQPYLPAIAKGMAEGMGGGIAGAAGKLFGRVRDLFRDDPEAGRALDRLAQEPEATDARATVEQRLAAKMAEDAALTAEIRSLLRAVGPVTQTAQGGDGARIVQNVGSNNRITM